MSHFDAAYEGTPPWDIGRPQRMFVELFEHRRLREPILDVGCGTGEHVLFLTAKGLEVMGVDSSARAIEKAKGKARERRMRAIFRQHDALDLVSLKRTFRTVIDNGLFHTFADEERSLFADQIAQAIVPGGTYFMACFSEREPEWGGPRRVTKAEIREAFQPPRFRVRSIADETFETHLHGEGGAKAYLSEIERV